MSLADVKHNCLTAILSKNGHTDDLELEFVQALIVAGTKAGTIQGAWHQYWDEQAVPAGNYNDRAWAWLATGGFTQDSLNERWIAFWITSTPP